MLILTLFDRIDMQPEECSESELININEEVVVTKKMQISQRKNFPLRAKNFTLKELLEIFHNIGSAKDKTDPNLE